MSVEHCDNCQVNLTESDNDLYCANCESWFLLRELEEKRDADARYEKERGACE